MRSRGTAARARVIVAGGSIAGLFAGALLRRLGFAVDVLERSAEALASRGAGIVQVGTSTGQRRIDEQVARRA